MDRVGFKGEKSQNGGGRYALSDNPTVGRVNFGAKNLAVILNKVKNPLGKSVDDER